MAGLGASLLYGLISAAFSAAVAWIFAPDMPDMEGPRMDGSAMQSSAYGQPIKKCYGETRYAGNVIWSEGIQEHVTQTEVGGKGGDSGTMTSYSYTCSFAVGLCGNQIAGVRRIWADGKLMYDGGVGEDGDYTQFIAGLKDLSTISIYTGTTTQLADSVMEAVEGSGNVPGYRGLAYVVFEDLELADYGNRIPNLEFEILASGAETSVIWDMADSIDFTPPSGFEVSTVTIIPQGFAFVYHSSAALYITDGAPGTITQEFDTTTYSTYEPTMVYNKSKNELYLIVQAHYIHRYNLITNEEYLPSATFQSYYLGIKELRFSNDGNTIIGTNPSTTKTIHVYHTSLIDAFEDGDQTIDRNDHIKQTLDFDGVVYTTVEGTEYTIGTTPGLYRIMLVGLLENNDIVFLVGATLKSLVITDGLSTTIKTGYDKITTSPGHIDSAFLDDENRVYLASGAIFTMVVSLCEPLTPYPYTTIPSVSSKTAVSTIVSDVFDSSGLASADYDVTDLASTTVRGYLQNNPSTGIAMLQPLMQMFQFDIIEQDWQIICKRRTEEVTVNIPYDDIGAREYGGKYETPLAITQKSEAELPLELNYKYFDYGLDYQQNVQRASRSTRVVSTVEVQSIHHPFVMDPEAALQAVEKLFQTIWASRVSYKFATTVEYIDLVPGKVITIEGGNKMRIGSISLAFPNLLSIEAASEDAGSYISVNTSTTPYLPDQVIAGACQISVVFMGLPALDGTHSTPGFYIAVYTMSDFRGAAVYYSLDNGATWSVLQGVSSAAIAGNVTNALGSGDTEVIDGNTLNVNVANSGGDLSSTTELSMLAGSNTAAVGADGRWEIISYLDVVQETNGTYTLSNLIRGRKGTGHNMGNHTDSDKFVLLTESSIAYLTVPEEKISVTLQYKVVPFGASLQETPAVDFVCSGENLLPYSPAHVTGERDAAGNLTIDWIRRSRSSIGWNTSDVPMVEETEEYDITILDGVTLVRTITVTSATTTTYTATDQTTDFGSAQASIDLKIYQISAVVGRGNVVEATI